MQTHLKGFGLENFRVFKDYTWFDFAPITILTGPNSSGKSSLNKALYLIAASLSKNKLLDFDLTESVLQLGSFDRILNNKSSKKYFRFSLPYLLNNFPILGENSVCYLVIECKKNIKDTNYYAELSLKFNNETIIYIKDGKLAFDFQIFSKHLKGENFEIQESIFKSQPKNILMASRLDQEYAKIERKGKYCIVDNTKTENSDIYFQYKWKSKNQEHWTKSEVPFKEIIYSDEYKDLESLLKLYQNEIDIRENIVNSDLIFNIPVETASLDGEQHSYTFQEENHRPLKDALNKIGLDAYLVNFIDEKIINYKKLIQLSNVLNSIVYLPLLKSTPRRSYSIDSPDSDIVKNLIISFSNSPANKNEKKFIEKWQGLLGFNLGEIKTIRDDKLGILSLEVDSVPIVEKGFGITQIVALILSVVRNSEQKIIIIEEPETNLHPNFQSKLADFFIDAANTFGVQFIIETHSEYLIRKLQYLTAKKAIKTKDSIIYYFHDPNNVPVGEKQVKKIEILDDGGLSSDFGSGFFDEAINWKFELLRLKNSQNN